MSAPDFILIGAMKCGTTTLAAQLGAQEGIFLTEPKEPNYFSDNHVFARGPEWYAGLFDAARPGELRGEASTHYTKLPDLPEAVPRMKAALPEVRLIYIIRDPMARLVSHYIHEWSQGILTGPLDAAMLERYAPLVNYGCYGMQIAPYLEAYGREAVLLTSLERLKRDAGAELARIAAHIGHDGPVTWRRNLATVNASSERVRRLPMHWLLVDSLFATVLRRSLVPQLVRTRIREARMMKERPEIPEEARAGLARRFLEDRARLAEAFPGDPSLDLAYPFLECRA